MADFEVSGSFAADVSKFNAGMASAGGAAQAMANQAKAAGDKVVASFAQIKLDQFKPWDNLVAGMSQASGAATVLSTSLEATGNAARGHGAGIGFYAREVHALADEMLSGRFGQFQGTMANVGFTFLQSHTALIPYAAAVLAFGGTLAYLVVRAIEAGNALKQVQNAFALGGVADPGKEAINELIESLERLSGVSYDDSAKTVSAFANMKGATLPLIQGLTAGVVDFAEATGLQMPEAATILRRAFQDPATGARQLQEMIGGITGQQIALVEETQRSGSATAAQSALLRIFTEAMAGATSRIRDRTAAFIAGTDVQRQAGLVDGETAAVLAMVNARLEESVRRQDERTEALKRTAAEIRAQPNPRLDVQAGVDVARQVNPLETQLETARGKVEALQSSLKALQDEYNSGPLQQGQSSNLIGLLASQNQALRDAEREVERINVALGRTDSYDTRIAKINDAAAAEKRDAVETAQAKIAADNQYLGRFGQTAEERRRIEDALAQHQAELRNAQAALGTAQASVDIANAGKVTDAVLAGQLRRIAAQRVAAGQDRAEQERLNAEEIQARATAEEARDQIARQGAEERMTIETNAIKQREQAIRESANQGQTSHATELTELLAFNRKREAIERQYLTAVLGTYEEGSVEFDKYQRQLNSLASRYATERAQTERQVGQQIYQSWNQSFQQVGSSVSSQVMGIIRGTTTLRQAFGNVALDIVGQFVSAIAKMVASWAAGQAAMLASTISGSVARSTAETTGSGISIAGALANAVAHINAGVAATIAGVSGNQALITGPAAPAEGAAAGAVVAAQSYAALALDTGTWNVPGDMLANIHRGEMVVPAFDAEAFRQTASTGGGAGDVHIHYNQMGRIPQGEVTQHAEAIARSLQRLLSNNRSLRLSY